MTEYWVVLFNLLCFIFIIETKNLYSTAGFDPVAPPDIEIDCQIRQFTFNYSMTILPNINNYSDIFDGLELKSRCNISKPNINQHLRNMKYKLDNTEDNIHRNKHSFSDNQMYLKEYNIYIDSSNGDDHNDGSIDTPLRTISKSISICRFIRSNYHEEKCNIYLREGIYEILNTIKFYEIDSNIDIKSYNNEDVTLIGGRRITPEWKESKLFKQKIYHNWALINRNNNDPKLYSFKGKYQSLSMCSSSCQLPYCYAVQFDNSNNDCYEIKTAMLQFKYEDNMDVVLNLNIYQANLSQYNFDEINTVVINNKRAIRARYPNADPETMGRFTQYTGYMQAPIKYFPPTKVNQSLEIHSTSPQIPKSYFSDYAIGLYGQSQIFKTHESYWGVSSPRGGSTYKVPRGLQYDPQQFTPNNWTYAKGGIVHTYHSGFWGSWHFRISEFNASDHTIFWDYGGFQEARGSTGGQMWYMDNIFDELDAPCEFFYNEKTKTLFYYPNSTINEAKEIIIPEIESFFHFEGLQDHPISNINISGIKFKYTINTYMRTFLVPSGGDWSLHPDGSIFIKGTHNLTIMNCLFERLGSNAIYITDHNLYTDIHDNEFKWLSESAIISNGITQLNDGTKGTHPRYLSITHNLFHELGIFVKQTAAIFFSKTADVTISHNIIFNAPRSGININDPFGGGHLIYRNILFNLVRETSDHGCFNSWDRMPILTNHLNDIPSYDKKDTLIHHNLFISNYHSIFPLDHDDGSCYFLDTHNVLIYGGWKLYLGHSKQGYFNFHYRPDVVREEPISSLNSNSETPIDTPLKINDRSPTSKSSSGLGTPLARYCLSTHTPELNKSGWGEIWQNNTCIIGTDLPLRFIFTGTNYSELLPASDYNQFYTLNGSFRAVIKEFSEYWNITQIHNAGIDVHSDIKDINLITQDFVMNKIQSTLELEL